MATRRFCDLCDSKIEGGERYHAWKMSGADRQPSIECAMEREVCVTCANKISLFVKDNLTKKGHDTK